jgi:hypothetical protein
MEEELAAGLGEGQVAELVEMRVMKGSSPKGAGRAFGQSL